MMTTDKLIKHAVALGYLDSADEYYDRDADTRELIVKRLGRIMTKKFGQGWSR
jgi:hypothetical protein